MKPQRSLMAAGRAASHCEALFPQPAEPADLLPELGRLGQRLAGRLGPVLAAFTGTRTSEVRVVAVDRTTSEELAGAIGGLAANAMMSIGAGKPRMLFSIDGAALLAQLDRAFGGTGEIDKLPAELPLSADLLARRVEQGVAPLLGELLGAAEPLIVGERAGSYAALAPFDRNEALALVALEVTDGGAHPLTMRLAARVADLAAILPSTETQRRTPRRQIDPLDGPFAEITLTLEAVLSEMRIPLSRLATLAPGQTLMIPVARAVPLRIGGTVVARGTVGELDDHVALQITQSTASKKDFQ